MGNTNFLFLGGNLCLDFLNTQLIQRGQLTDLLRDDHDVLDWLANSGVFEQGELEQAQVAEPGALLSEALALREALRAMVTALRQNSPVPSAALQAVNHYLSAAPIYTQVKQTDGHYLSHTHYRLTQPEHLFFPVADAARWLLTESDHSRIKSCSSPTCVLLFYDTSKNLSRRWCSMETCGNRGKAKRHYERRQGDS